VKYGDLPPLSRVCVCVSARARTHTHTHTCLSKSNCARFGMFLFRRQRGRKNTYIGVEGGREGEREREQESKREREREKESARERASERATRSTEVNKNAAVSLFEILTSSCKKTTARLLRVRTRGQACGTRGSMEISALTCATSRPPHTGSV
jgi:hypothetical protein